MASSRSIALVLLWFVALAGPPARAADMTPADLVLVRQGTLPIILTAPHGGREAVPGIDPRQDRTNVAAYRGWGGFHTSRDGNTDMLARGIAAEIAKLTGKEPYLVVAKFERRFIDANRPPELALDSREARPYYDYYRESVRHFVDDIREHYAAGLLIDVHGQDKGPAVVMRGTINGRTVDRLLRRAGDKAVTGPNGIFGQLEANGFKVFPANDVPLSGRNEDAGFNGGYTVSEFGSQNRNGIDAVQMEFGTAYRTKAALDKSIRDAAKAIVAFHEAYLKQPADR
jgi:N-formylglutamate amidohydrolase